MVKNILTQGITTDTDNSAGTAIITLLNSPDYHSFTAISAFASTAGIELLRPHIEKAKADHKEVTIIVGVDQKSTSKEALEGIMALDVKSGIFYQAGSGIFHPKIYLFEGDEKSQLIIGSSNLTEQGVFINVEVSIHFEAAHDNADEMRVITDLKTRFSTLFDFSDPNLKTITAELIAQFVAEKIVPTEAESKAIRAKAKESEDEADEPAESVIRKLFPPRARPSVPAEFRRKRAAKVKAASAQETAGADEETDELTEVAADEQYELVWQRDDVPGASVQFASSSGTKLTGMMRLVQAGYLFGGKPIDQTTYFRNVVFNNLSWAQKTADTEIAIGIFNVSILGKEIGQYPLRIRHKPSGEAGQGNYTTGISWGILGTTIRAANLTGKTVKLYRLDGSDDTFRLEFV